MVSNINKVSTPAVERQLRRRTRAETDNLHISEDLNTQNTVNNGLRTSSRLRNRAAQDRINYTVNTKRRKTEPVDNNINLVKKGEKNDDSDIDLESDSSLSEYDFPDVKPIKVVLGSRPQYVTNPTHVIKPAENNRSIDGFFRTYKTFIDDRDMSPEDYTENVNNKMKLYEEIEDGILKSKLKVDPVSNEIKLASVRDYSLSKNHLEPIKLVYKEQNMFSLQDHLINHAIVMKKLFNQMHKNKLRVVRKLNNMVETHFKSAKNAKEREAKERLKFEKQMCKKVATMVKKHWLLASKAYNIISEMNIKETEEIERKKNLNEMLEKSSKLLDRQLNKSSMSPDDSDSHNVSKDSDSDNESDLNDVNFSNDDDDSLTVEQLRLKYGSIEDVSSKESENAVSDEDFEFTEEQLKIMKEEEKNGGNHILDETSASESASDSDASVSSGSDDDLVSGDSGSDQGLSALVDEIDSETSLTDDDFSSKLSDDELEKDELNEDLSNDELEKDKVDGELSNDESPKEEVNGELSNNESAKEEVNEELSNAQPLLTNNANETVLDVEVPTLLKGTLRVYQKQGLNWLANLYNTKTNGILADEMGLGKTIQTISLLCYLAEFKHFWGPHLIIVPTSVLLNWEMEFKKFAPGLKILAYFGSPNERAKKRKGWNTPNTFHVVITSYQLAVTDQHVFKRKKWGYMILDEAHNIKNFRSGRWQALLSFNSERRLLLTGTPLQNNLTELWSLLYFLMPRTLLESGELEGFADLESFQEWFGKPVDKIIEQDKETSENEHRMKVVNKLHQILRPYLLRRLKKDVEKQMPAKYEHIVPCKLSKRQRYLYDEFMSRTQTKETLKSGNYLSIINCLMQLRKVCNHPDLFEVRPIVTSFAFKKNVNHDFVFVSKKIVKLLHENLTNFIDKDFMNLKVCVNSDESQISSILGSKLSVREDIMEQVEKLSKRLEDFEKDEINFQDIDSFYTHWEKISIVNTINKLLHLSYINENRLNKNLKFSKNLVKLLTLDTETPEQQVDIFNVYSILIEKFCFITPSCLVLENNDLFFESVPWLSFPDSPFNQLEKNLSIEFPDKFLLQYDCGKLQKLATLLKQLKDGGHKALIFTQMTRILDILEIFLNYHHYTYSRLDGGTKIEDRQLLTERFNNDPKIFCFILSSRSGGVGINLTGADTVIFYDSDWNPAMDKQCQDRCHRIGQMRDVNIYRLVSEHTIESNILNKAMQKTQLDNLVIQDGNFNTDFLDNMKSESSTNLNKMLILAEDEDDSKAAKLAMTEMDKNENEDAKEFNEGLDESEDKIQELDGSEDPNDPQFHEGTRHVEDYMLRFISAGYFY